MTDNKVTFASTNSYSQALYELGNEAGTLNEIEDQAIAILKLVSENEEVKNFIKNPIIKKILQAIKPSLEARKSSLERRINCMNAIDHSCVGRLIRHKFHDS